MASPPLSFPFFEEMEDRCRLVMVLDGLNSRYAGQVELETLFGKDSPVPLRIPFGAPERSP